MTSLASAAGQREVLIPVGATRLPGILAWPLDPLGAVLFVHGSGSGRLSPRHVAVAQHLRVAGVATLLFDLLTEPEGRDRGNVFDIEFLAGRLLHVTEWLASQPEVAGLGFGFFGASTGAAAALKAAASRTDIGAVVSRGGRPDLAGAALSRVLAPTLFLVGSRDPIVLQLNQAALIQLTCIKQLVVIPGASHLFEEPGTLLEAAGYAARWFVRYLAKHPSQAGHS